MTDKAPRASTRFFLLASAESVWQEVTPERWHETRLLWNQPEHVKEFSTNGMVWRQGEPDDGRIVLSISQQEAMIPLNVTELPWHRCGNGKVKRYPSVLCSGSCRGSNGDTKPWQAFTELRDELHELQMIGAARVGNWTRSEPLKRAKSANSPEPFQPPKDEYILCAAIYVDTGAAEPPRRSYSYPKTGLVFTGWRHGDCYTTLNAWKRLLPKEEVERMERKLFDQMHGRVQGFMTSSGRFVDRVEARAIAFAAGQVDKATGDLHSEDLY